MFNASNIKLHKQQLVELIAKADQAITNEDFTYLINFYSENGSLVVRDDLYVSGKENLRKAFIAIAEFFNHTLHVAQGTVKVIFGEDCALVLAETLLSAKMHNGANFNTVREATYVFKYTEDQWLCVIDNSYGTDLLQSAADARLHFLCGKIASGKSTLAKTLANNARTVLISEDAWLSILYPGQLTELSHYIEKSALIKSVLETHILQLISAGNTVVMDFPANTPAQRKWLKSLAESSGIPYVFHVLKVDSDECKRRLSKRNEVGDNPFKTSDAEFDLITQHFSYPSDDEQLICQDD